MNNKNEKILYRVKSNRFLFVAKAVWNIIWFSIGTTISIGLGTLLLSGILGFLCNDNKLNLPVIYLGAILIPLTIAVRILHIILLRKNQFYTISSQSITSEGGVLISFNHTLRRNQIQSVSYTQTLIQQLLGCGNIVVSTSATHRAALILHNVDQVMEIYSTINHNR